jgi:hypothetical protein
MSAESFFRSSQPDNAFVQRINRLYALRSDSASLVATLGDVIADSSVQGLTALMSLARRGAVAPFTPEAEELQHAHAVRDLAGVIFGTSLKYLELAVTHGTYRMGEFANRVNELCQSATFPFAIGLSRPTLPTEVLTPSNHEQLITAAREDPTLACFFQEGYEYMLPDGIRQVLWCPNPYNNNLPHIVPVRQLLPSYESLAKTLTHGYAPQRTQMPKAFDVVTFERFVKPKPDIRRARRKFTHQLLSRRKYQ